MKKILTTFYSLILYCICFPSSAIEWAPIGTRWYYDFKGPEAFGYVLMESCKDTIINGNNYRILSLTENSFIYPGVYKKESYDTLLTYQEGSKIYKLNCDTICLLYDFNPSPGDIWDVMGATPYAADRIECGGKVIVDSVKKIKIDEQYVNEIFTSPFEDSFVSYTGSIIEGIGSTYGIFPKSSSPCSEIVDYEETLGIRCFYSPEIDTSFIETACDYITQITDLYKDDNDFVVFPNPATKSLELIAKKSFANYPIVVRLYSLSGVEIACFKLDATNLKIDTTNINSGVYILRITDSKSVSYNVKFLKK